MTSQPLDALLPSDALLPPEALLFVRRLDGLTYRFEREPDDWGGRPSYRRTDLPLRIRSTGEHGWVVLDADGAANGWPLADATDPAPGAPDPVSPPLGAWRSRKGATSYLYDLRRADDGLPSTSEGGGR